MSKHCELTGARPQSGNSISHSKKATRRRWEPNLKYKKIYLPDEGRWIHVRATVSALKTLTRKGKASLAKMRAKVLRSA